MWHWHEREHIAAWQEAAAGGDTEAMLHLARAAKHSHHPDAEAEAERWLRAAADRGSLEAVHKLGIMLWHRGECEAGEELVRQAAAVTGPAWLLVLGYAGHGLKDFWQERSHYVAGTRWWPPFCAAVDWLVAVVLAIEIIAGAGFHH